MDTKRIFAVGKVCPEVGIIIVCEQDVDDAWHAAMQDSIDASLEVDDAGAYELGHAHALNGEPSRCGVYEQLTHQYEYLTGYRDALSTLDFEEYLQDVDWLRGRY